MSLVIVISEYLIIKPPQYTTILATRYLRTRGAIISKNNDNNLACKVRGIVAWGTPYSNSTATGARQQRVEFALLKRLDDLKNNIKVVIFLIDGN